MLEFVQDLVAPAKRIFVNYVALLPGRERFCLNWFFRRKLLRTCLDFAPHHLGSNCSNGGYNTNKNIVIKETAQSMGFGTTYQNLMDSDSSAGALTNFWITVGPVVLGQKSQSQWKVKPI